MVTTQMAEGVDSLNAAVAGAIVMDRLRQAHPRLGLTN